jgi:hypothetical protein
MGFFDFLRRGTFDPASLQFEYVLGGGRLASHHEAAEASSPVRVQTVGLSRFDRSELALADVPVVLLDAATFLLRTVAEHHVSKATISANQTCGFDVLGCQVLLRARTLPGVSAVALTDLYGGTRVVEGAPRALTGVMARFAEGLFERDETEVARTCLLQSAVAFTGDDDVGDEVPRSDGAPLNTGNALTWLGLCQHSAEAHQRELAYAILLRNSYEARALEFGQPARHLSRPEVAQAVTAMVAENLTLKANSLEHTAALTSKLGLPETVALVATPLLVPTPDGSVEWQANLVPRAHRRYWLEDGAAGRVTSEASIALLTDLNAAAVDDFAATLAPTLGTRTLYLGPLGQGLLVGDGGDSPFPRVAATATDTVLARLVADVGRRLAAGLTHDEIRAAYLVLPDDAAKASAQRKMEALEWAELGAMMTSMGAPTREPSARA